MRPVLLLAALLLWSLAAVKGQETPREGGPMNDALGAQPQWTTTSRLLKLGEAIEFHSPRNTFWPGTRRASTT